MVLSEDEDPNDKKRRSSAVWRFFSKVAKRKVDGKEVAKCNECGKLIGTSNTTNMRNNLVRKHKKIYIMDHRTGQAVRPFQPDLLPTVKNMLLADLPCC